MLPQPEQPTRPTIIFLLVCQSFVLFLLSYITMNSQSHVAHVPDLELYLHTAKAVMQGQLPYRDFPLEYPPAAIIPMLVPCLFTGGVPADIEHYSYGLIASTIVWNALIFLTLVQMTKKHLWPLSSEKTLQLYTIFVIVLSPLLTWRYDIFPALLTVVALRYLLEGRSIASGLALGLGVAAKLYPIVLMPIMLVALVINRNRRDAWQLCVGTGIALAVFVLPFWIASGDHFLNFLTYHEKRGLEIETIPAGVLLLARQLGLIDMHLIGNYGAIHLLSPLATDVVRVLPFVFIALYGLILFLSARQFRSDYADLGAVNPESIINFIVATLIAFIIANKVFSAQYLIWLLPFATLVRMNQMRLLMLSCILTMAVFPYTFALLIRLKPSAVILLNVRNVVVIALFVSMLIGSKKSFIQQR